MISGIVLAAGLSTRMGRPKLVLDLAGKPILRHVVEAALAAGLDEVIVVLGPTAAEIRQAAEGVFGGAGEETRVRFVVNEEAALGQSTSLRAGLRAASAGALAAVVMLGDQPEIRPAAVAAVVRAFREDPSPIVQATYGGRPAHPTLLAREAWVEIAAEGGDRGARGFIARNPERRRLVEVGGDPPDDVDTEEDYARVRARVEQA